MLETGGLAEDRYLGGPSVIPKPKPEIVDKLANENKLVKPSYYKNPAYREKIKILPEAIKTLLQLGEEFYTTLSQEHKRNIADQMHKIRRRLGHKFLEDALIRYTMHAQQEGYDPSDPWPIVEGKKSHEFINDLHAKLAQQFCKDKNIEEQYDLIKFYNTVETPLDSMYGTDGFFVADGSLFPDGNPRYIPIDLTTNPNKADMETNPSGSILLFLDKRELEDENLDQIQSDFAEKILRVANMDDRFLN